MTSRVDEELLSAFNAIDPSSLDYDEWFKVSAVMHDEGLSEAEWDAWNQRDSERYTERKNSRKWASIRGDGTATRKTVFMLAYERGWSWHGKSTDGRYGWNDAVATQDNPTTTTPPDKPKATEKPPADNPPKLEDYGEPEQIHELPEDMEPAEMLRRQISALFDIGEKASIALADQTHWNAKRNKWEPLGGTVYDAAGLAHGDNPSGVLAKVNEKSGAWIRINPTTGGSDADVTRYATALVESDEITTDEQLKLMMKLHLPCRCITSSAGKSVHAAVIIDARDYDEYRERVRWLYDYCDANGLKVDRANKNPGRYTRLAGATRGDSIQRLVCESMGPQSWSEFRRVVADLAGHQDEADGEQDDVPRIDFIDMSDIIDEPIEQPDYVVQDLLPREHIAQLVSRGGSGKTYLAYGLLFSTVSGREWLGFGCKRGRVLYVDPELHIMEIKKRLKYIACAMGLTAGDVSGAFDIVSLRGMTATADVLDVAIRDRVASTGKPYDLIIIDSINAILTGDENSSVDVRALFASLQRLTKDTGAACLIIHHEGKGLSKDDGARGRGSSVFLDGPDVCMELVSLRVDPDSAAAELLHAFSQTKPNGELIPATAWRLTFPKNRAGAPIKPIDLVFRHPMHIVDHTGELASCKVAGSNADYGKDGGDHKGENFRRAWSDMDAALEGIIADIHMKGGKATRAACLDLLNERRKAMGLKGWSKAHFRNNTLPNGKLRYRVDLTTNELYRLTDEQLEAEGGTVPNTP